MKKHKDEQTLVLIKPDGVQRTLIGEVIRRVERTGLKLVGLKMTVASESHAREHYTLEPAWIKNVGEKSIEAYEKQGKNPPFEDPEEAGKVILEKLVKYITSGPVVALVWQGAHATSVVRKIVGGTEPRTSDVGTIRGDFVIDSYELADIDERSVRNLVHASGTPEEAEKEIKHWFKDEEIISYRLVQDEILYDVNLDGILE